MANHPYYEDQYHKGDAPFQFPWWAVLAGFVTWFPLGFIFLGVNEYSRRMGKNTAPRPRPAPAPAARAPIYTVQKEGGGSPVAKDAARARGIATMLSIVGALLLIGGLASGGEAVEMLLWSVVNSHESVLWYLGDLFSGGLLPIGLGLGALFGAGAVRTNSRMRKKIANIVGDAPYMKIGDIAAAIPCKRDKCIKALENCIDKGVFGPEAYLDMRTGYLVVHGRAPEPEPKKPPKPASAATEKSDPYEQILQELRRVNDAIPDKEMSERISQLESISAHIFQQVANNPEKQPQMRKFMDYYLPTSLKLLRTYAELEAQGVEGDNIRLSKQRIRQAMDTVVVAFENQLDQLFRADAMDVSADIEVMEKMLRADGLAESQSPAAPPTPHLQL